MLFDSIALMICCGIDGNSIFQVILCGTMWGLNRWRAYLWSPPGDLDCISRFQRPPWSTGILIPASFLCGIASAVLIWYGGKKTKRVEKVEEFLKAALAMEEKQRASNQGSPAFSPRSTSRLPASPLSSAPITSSDAGRGEKRVVDSMVVESMIVPKHEDLPDLP